MDTASHEPAPEPQQPGVAVPRAARTAPVPPDFLTWPLFKQACGTIASLALTGFLLAAAFLPFLALLAGGVWAAGTFLHELAGLTGRFSAGDFTAVISGLDTMDVAGRAGFFCASYFTLLFSFVVLFTGLLGRRRQQLYLIPGVILACLSALGFVVAAQFLFASFLQASLALDIASRLLLAYVAVDAVALGALLADLRPSRRARQRRAHERERILALAHATVAQDGMTARIVPVLTPKPEIAASAPYAVQAQPAEAEAPGDAALAAQTSDEDAPAGPHVDVPLDSAPVVA